MRPASFADRLSSVDASYLFSETAEEPLHTGWLLFFDQELPFEGFLAGLEERLARVPLLTRKAVPVPWNAGLPTWEDDAAFDLRRHVVLHRLDAEGGSPGLAEKIGSLLGGVLERDRPLWEMHLIHGLENGGSAVLAKIHHAISDGVCLHRLLHLLHGGARARRSSSPGTPASALEAPLTRMVEGALDGGLSAFQAGLDSLRSLGELGLALASDEAAANADALTRAASDLLRPLDPLPFNRPATGGRRVRWLQVPLERVQSAGRKAGGTVNDVLLATLAGALGRYLEHHGVAAAGRAARFVLGVDFRHRHDREATGNDTSFLPLTLELGPGDPARRLQRIVESTRRLKDARVSDAMRLLINGRAMLAPAVQAAINAWLPQVRVPAFNLVCTNAAALAEPLSAAGLSVRECYLHSPVAFGVGVSCAVFTYRQAFSLCFNADAGACSDLDLLAQGFEESLAELEAATVGETGG